MRLIAIFAALMVNVLALSWTSPVSATPLNSWEHTCFKGEGSPGQVCTTELHTVYEGEEFVFYFARGPKGAAPLVVQGGELAFTAMTITVDENEAVAADNCVTGSCHFEAKKSRKLLRQFRKGQTAKIEIMGEGPARLFDGTITLMGFTAAYQRYR